MLLIELMTFTPTQNVGSKGVVVSDLRKYVESNIHLIRSMYNGGCGYDNFARLFENLAKEITKSPLQWDKFNDTWDEHIPNNMAVSYNLQGHAGNHIDFFITLLEALTK